MESTHPFSVSFAPCFQAVLCRSQLFFRMFLDKLLQICADRFTMKQKRRCFSPFLLSPSSRRAWIEIALRRYFRAQLVSPSSRRAWIEISFGTLPRYLVANVALLAEGVDRNIDHFTNPSMYFVALLAEGVDRNHIISDSLNDIRGSPSSRRAWIEITLPAASYGASGRRPPRGGRG